MVEALISFTLTPPEVTCAAFIVKVSLAVSFISFIYEIILISSSFFKSLALTSTKLSISNICFKKFCGKIPFKLFNTVLLLLLLINCESSSFDLSLRKSKTTSTSPSAKALFKYEEIFNTAGPDIPK